MAKPGSLLSIFEAALKEVFSARNQQRIADEMADTVKIRAQLGGAVEKAQSKKKPFKKLSETYIEQRKKDSNLSSLTSPSKSNITRTGQLIESLKGLGKQNGFEIFPSGSRSDGKSNSDVADHVEKAGRPFLSLSDVEIKKLKRLLEEQLVDEINKKLGK